MGDPDGVDMVVQGKPSPADTAGWSEDRRCPGRWGVMTVGAGFYFRNRTPSLRWAAGRAGPGLRAQPGWSEGCGQDRDLEGKLGEPRYSVVAKAVCSEAALLEFECLPPWCKVLDEFLDLPVLVLPSEN